MRMMGGGALVVDDAACGEGDAGRLSCHAPSLPPPTCRPTLDDSRACMSAANTWIGEVSVWRMDGGEGRGRGVRVGGSG